MEHQYFTNTPAQTRKLGKELAKKITEFSPKEKAVIVGLQGNLGSGKTNFLQGFAKGLGVKERILSPTFVIMRKFKICKKLCKFENFYHVDCYRIQNYKEIWELGFEKIISDPKNIVAVEWVDNLKKNILPDMILATFKVKNKNKRKIYISAAGIPLLI